MTEKNHENIRVRKPMEMGVSVRDGNDGDYYYYYVLIIIIIIVMMMMIMMCRGDASRCYNDMCCTDNDPVVTRLRSGPTDLSFQPAITAVRSEGPNYRVCLRRLYSMTL